MQFYLTTSFIFPRSLRFRLFALCFVTTHLPLLGYMGWGAATGRIAWAEFIVLTLATMAGAAGALLGIGALLDPIHALADALHPQEGTERKTGAPTLPEVSDIIFRLFSGMRLSGVRRAATATQEQIDELNIAAHEDALTGIANRRGFLAQLDALPLSRRRGCIAIIDLDHFKQVNDVLGHDAGDRLLTGFATRLSSQTRRIDIVARWGGEEFAIFYQDAIEDEASWSLARIAERMRQEPVGAVNGQPVTFSAGLCAWRGGPVTAAISMADEALYHAKRSGRDQIQRAARPSASAYG
ncbi:MULTISPECIES: GGDEF domain-containing protein [Sphingobium]|uniref:GGDEF domain-containing protein n=1 Tax=Sphingobium TaxID=165695 RepID=UPI00159C90FE|nr:GGDEF domain-containing protein [Sphingobium sp. 15-1]